ncbi:MAG: hypothetical protein KBT46_07910 [Ruminococcus sp.]|nr:hypothetical protein [Candidatus Copronaster equi]
MEKIDTSRTCPKEKPRTAGNFLKAFLFYFVQWTWGLPVNLVGGIFFLYSVLFKKRKWQHFGYSYIVYIPWKSGALTLGIFIFMRSDHPKKDWSYNTRIHEYGHTWQCLILGPLYYIVIAVPSMIWCNCFRNYREKNNVSYYSLYCEGWANSFGEYFSKMKMTYKFFINGNRDKNE